MANKRMFSLTVVDSDEFLEMPLSTQALYFHLAIRADDDGFINNPKRIVRLVGAANDEIKVLLSKGFVLLFKSGIMVVTHWRVHNTIRSDRYHPTINIEEMKHVTLLENKIYSVEHGNVIPDGNQMSYQRLPQDRIEEDSIGKNSNSPAGRDREPEDFIRFYEAYPKKRERADALKAWKTHKQNLPDIGTLVTAVERWKQSDEWKRERGQFIPYPAKWIRRQCWLDEIPESAEEKRLRLLNDI